MEQVDDECDVFGIHMVKIQDPQLAKRYSIKTFPALVYFRNGNPLIFEGDLQNEQSVLEWLIDDDNRELADEIEEVNERMLERLMQDSSLLCVFFCKSNQSLPTLKSFIKNVHLQMTRTAPSALKSLKNWRISTVRLTCSELIS